MTARNVSSSTTEVEHTTSVIGANDHDMNSQDTEKYKRLVAEVKDKEKEEIASLSQTYGLVAGRTLTVCL